MPRAWKGERQFLRLKKGALACYYWFEKAADSGHAASEYSLANLYRTGGEDHLEELVEIDVTKAVDFFESATEKGHASAETNMGIMYFQGFGRIEQGDAMAVSYFRRAQGDDDAQFSLTWMYQHGQGVAKDVHATSFWYGRAADQGHAQASILGRSPG